MQTMMKVFAPIFLLVILLTTAVDFPALAQPITNDDQYAHLSWEGTVDGKIRLRINRRRVDHDIISGLPLQRQRYNFTDPLPFKNTRVEVNVEQGRGSVRVIEQPRERNDYTAIIEINDSSSGTSNYVIDVYWERAQGWDGRPDNGSNWRNPNDDYFEWQGRVDNESILYIRGEEIRVEHVSGNGITNERSRFSRPLPARAVQVNLVETSGRGEITLIEQPSRRNDFTAAVKILDRQSGSGSYAFALTWSRRGGRDDRNDWPGNPGQGEGRRGLIWQGRVDGRDLLYVRGDQIQIEHQAGAEITEMNYRFERSLPERATFISVEKRKGRGKVTILQQPDRNNNFTAIIQIEDKDGGSSFNEIEVRW